MSIIRNKVVGNFSQIPNQLILDKRLSDKSVRMMAYLLSLPDGWVINNTDIMNKLDIKRRETIAKYWKELINAGWVFRTRSKLNNGQFDIYEYILHTEVSLCTVSSDMEPCTDLDEIPCTIQPYSGQNSTLNNTHYFNNTYSNNTNKNKQKEIEDIYCYWNEKTKQELKGDKQIIKSLEKILKDYTLDDIKSVIDYMILNTWFKQSGNLAISTLARSTKFGEKLDKARVFKPRQTTAQLLHRCNSNDYSEVF